MIDFASVKSITIPEGNVKKITAGGVVIWKKAEENQWVAFVQPVLSANGTIGGDSFAVGASVNEAYKAFDNSASSYCNRLNADQWLEWYNPQPLCIGQVKWQASGNVYMQRAGLLQYSDDNAAWITAVEWTNSDSTNPFTIQVGETHGSHKYWRLYFTQKGTSSGNSDVSNLVLTATYQLQ